MDIYEAAQAALTALVPTANVTFLGIEYNANKDEFTMPAAPAVTYNFSAVQPVNTHSGGSGLYKVDLDVDLWAALGDVAAMAAAIETGLNGARRTQSNVAFCLVEYSAQDVIEVGLTVKHRLLRFRGLAEITPAE